MRSRGYSLVEAMLTLSIFVTLAAIATPSVLNARDYARAVNAADHLASLLQLTRLEALKRHVNVALRFEPQGDDYRFVMYADGNGNGVRAADIADGTDGRIRAPEQLRQQAPGVGFELADGVPLVDGDEAEGSGPIHAGRSRMISFSPVGTSTSGTVYLLGRGRQQFAVRVLGPTARIRSFRYHFAASAWRAR